MSCRKPERIGSRLSPQSAFHTCTAQQGGVLCSDAFTTATNSPQDSDERRSSRGRMLRIHFAVALITSDSWHLHQFVLRLLHCFFCICRVLEVSLTNPPPPCGKWSRDPLLCSHIGFCGLSADFILGGSHSDICVHTYTFSGEHADAPRCSV